MPEPLRIPPRVLTRPARPLLAIELAAALTLTACATPEPPQAEPLRPAPSDVAADAPGPVEPVGEPTALVTGLQLPWSIAPLASGSTLISERDTALVKEYTADGGLRTVGEVPNVVPGGEGGLLGLAVLAPTAGDDDTTWLYAYTTAETDNRVIRLPLLGSAGAYSLGDPEVLLTGIAKARNHNGGRIAFGPDGMLYATAGDAGDTSRSQDPDSLNGKILRMTPTGAVPSDNPTAGSYMYSMGHRNPQGIAWDADGQLWAAEFGQDTWDEFNRIEPGANYGWPVVEGDADEPGYVDPEFQWPTSEASPSGLAFVRDTFFLAALRGQRVWRLDPTTAGVQAEPYFAGVYGRIRDVTAGPDGSLLMLTNNTGSNGEPREGDDQLVRVQLAPVADD